MDYRNNGEGQDPNVKQCTR